jgi:hypothetical protein
VQVVVPAVSLAAVLQGTALTVETPSGATLTKSGPVSISGKAAGCQAGAGEDVPVLPLGARWAEQHLLTVLPRCRIGPQVIEVVGVLVAAADREHINRAVHDPRRIVPIREHLGQLVGQTETPLGHR